MVGCKKTLRIDMISGRSIVFIATAIVLLIIAYDISTHKTAREPSHEFAIKSDQATWITYKAPNELFEVSLPTQPQHVSEAGLLTGASKDVKYDVFLSQGKDGTAFMISTIAYPTSFPQEQKQGVLDNVIKEILSSNPQSKVVKQESKTFQSFPALEFTINNSEYMSKSMAILAEQVLFVLTVMDKNPHHLDEDFQFFVDSLKIIKNHDRPTPPKDSRS
jgi:hypothetical protein